METREKLDEQKTSTAPPEFKSQKYSNAQPVWQFILLSALTFGVYLIIWFNRNWRQLKAHKNLNIRPGLRTVGLFVPILNLVLIYKLLRSIRDFSKEIGLEKLFSPGWIIFWLIVFSAVGYSAPVPYKFLNYLVLIPLGMVQRDFNSYWKNEQSGLPIRKKLSGGQIVILIIGAIVSAAVIPTMLGMH